MKNDSMMQYVRSLSPHTALKALFLSGKSHLFDLIFQNSSGQATASLDRVISVMFSFIVSRKTLRRTDF